MSVRVPPAAQQHLLTRRALLGRVGALAAVAGAGGGLVEMFRPARRPPRIRSFALKPKGPVRVFHSRPDLKPPTVRVSGPAAAGRPVPASAAAAGGPSGRQASAIDALAEVSAAGVSSRLLFLGPGPVSLSGSDQYGPLIVDRHGEPVWFRPLASGLEATNFALWHYRGRPVLAWWEGVIRSTGYGQGEAVILDSSYRELARVRAASGRSIDLHAFRITPRGTALFSCYPETVPADLSAVGGPRDGQALESIIQEVDISTGRLLLEWRSLGQIPVQDSYEPLRDPYDYLHVNSIDETPDGNLLVSGRHTWALYKLERRTGRVIWTLGGRRTGFAVGSGVQFAWQHDAMQPSPGVLSVFDNGTNGPVVTERQSRGLLLALDERRRSVSLKRAYTSPDRLSATAMGSVEILPSGQVLVGFGTASHTTEFAADGSPLLDAALPEGLYSYRGLSFPFKAIPRQRPQIAADRDPDTGARRLYVSWNGATEVSGWRVDAGRRADGLRPLGIARRRGFETVIPVRPELRFAAVTALDRSGSPLARSHTIRI